MVLPTKKTYERVLLKGTSPRRETITPKTVLPKKVLPRIPPKMVLPTKKTYERVLLKGTSPRRETITPKTDVRAQQTYESGLLEGTRPQTDTTTKKTYERGLLKGTSPRRETITKKTYERGLLKGTSPRRETITKKTDERRQQKGTSPRREKKTTKTVLPKKVLRRISPKMVLNTKKTYERVLLKGTSPRRETITPKTVLPTKKTYERGLLKGTSPRRETITPKTVLPTKKTYENGKITIGFSFQVDKPPEWNSFLQSIKITCETTNEQLDQWKPVSHSKYSIGGVAKFVDKSWEQLELVAMHHCVLKYMFTFSLATSIVGEWKDGEDFVNNVLVLVGKKRKYFLEFLFKICALYPTMQKLYEAKDTLLSGWQKQVVGEEMSDTPLLSLIDSKFKELDSSTVVTEVADLLASVTSEHAYMNLFKFDRKGLLMTYEAMTQRESTLPRNEKRRRKREVLREPLPQEDIDRLWWDSLCCLAYARYLSITSDTNLKNAVHQAMGRTRAPRRKRVPAPPTAPAAGTSAAPASTPAPPAPAAGTSAAPASTPAPPAPAAGTSAAPASTSAPPAPAAGTSAAPASTSAPPAPAAGTSAAPASTPPARGVSFA